MLKLATILHNLLFNSTYL